jgi:phosphatidylglycerol:prolipoprotein diacylglycerol transferase
MFEALWIHFNVYWLMYALSFIIWFYIIKKRKIFTHIQWEDFFLFTFLGVIIGGRLWYVVFYNLSYYLENIHKILYVWEWWMSFHWGALWVILAMILFSRKYNLNFLRVSDELTSVLPIWLFLWRIGNYFNKELLWYSGYNGIFAVEKNWTTYFPSPLLEAFLEWFILYFILLYIYKNKKFDWQVWSLFLIFYGIFRILVEIFFRQPDEHIWYILPGLSLWIIYSLPMIIIWLWIYIYLSRKNEQ